MRPRPLGQGVHRTDNELNNNGMLGEKDTECFKTSLVASNVGSHSNATQKHSTRAQKMECYGSNPFVLKMDWS